jgi:hypothetical protein
MKFAHVPKEWRQAWEKGSKGEMRDLKEQGMGLGMKIAMNMDGSKPIWTGIITKAFIKLMELGNVPQTKTQKFIRFLRNTLDAHNTATWRYRCKMSDEHKSIQEDNLTRCPNLKKMFSAKEIKNMSVDQRKQLNQTYTGNIQTTQQRQMEDYFRTEPETPNVMRPPKRITKRPN